MTNNNDYLKRVVDDFGCQSVLASKLEVTRQMVSMWINNKRDIPVKYALKIQFLTKGKYKFFKLLSDEDKRYFMND